MRFGSSFIIYDVDAGSGFWCVCFVLFEWNVGDEREPSKDETRLWNPKTKDQPSQPELIKRLIFLNSAWFRVS